MIKLFYIKNKKERNLYIMQEKLKEIINSYPEFSRETVYNIVNEFNTKTLEKKILKVLQFLKMTKFIFLKKQLEDVKCS